MTTTNFVYALDTNEKVECYHCIQDGNMQSYGRDEAYLAGPDHSPYDSNANYICCKHLDEDAVICDVTDVK